MNKNLIPRAADVLLVVSDYDEQRQIRESLQHAEVKNRLHHVGQAADAILYLRREGPYMDAPSPGLVLLDASLPQPSVIDLITELKTDARFAGIPVIVLVGSESDHQLIENCIYAVDGSIQKPFDLAELIQVLNHIDALSFLLVKSPLAI